MGTKCYFVVPACCRKYFSNLTQLAQVRGRIVQPKQIGEVGNYGFETAFTSILVIRLFQEGIGEGPLVQVDSLTRLHAAGKFVSILLPRCLRGWVFELLVSESLGSCGLLSLGGARGPLTRCSHTGHIVSFTELDRN